MAKARQRNNLSRIMSLRVPWPISDALADRAASDGASVASHAVAAMARGLNFDGANLSTRTNPPHRPKKVSTVDP